MTNKPVADQSGGCSPFAAHPLAQANTGARDEAQQRLEQRLGHIRQKVLVLSGKGGVGKSTVAANLAMSLALAGCKVGLLDIDIHGPSIPKLLGLEGETCSPAAEDGAIQPVAIGPNLKVMSIGFLLRSPREAVIWRGPLKYKIIQQFLADVTWGALDVLVIDSPPGTGDEPLSIAQLVVSGDAGTPFVHRFADSPTARAFEDIVRPFLDRLEPAPRRPSANFPPPTEISHPTPL